MEQKNMIEKRIMIEKLNKLEEEKQNSDILQFRDLKQNVWYKVLECSDKAVGVYGEYFVITLLDTEENKTVRAFSIKRLADMELIGKYIKYKGKKGKKNGTGVFHDVCVVCLS